MNSQNQVSLANLTLDINYLADHTFGEATYHHFVDAGLIDIYLAI